MGVNILNSLRFPEVDTSSARNDFSGLYNAPSYPNSSAFANYQRVHLSLHNLSHPTP
jgi:hypothetical protein